jgi:diguanylate cyclase (GGDEF)-like protein
MKGAGASQRFFSLRWTIIIFLSLVLILVNSTLAYLNYTQSSRQYDAELKNVRALQTRQIKELLKNGYTALSSISTFIPLIGDSKSSDSFENSFREMLQQSGTILDIEWGIQSIYLFSKERELLLQWPDIAGLDSTVPSDIILHKARPSTDLICSVDCLQFVASPILDAGDTIGYLVLGRSIASPIITFNRLTQSDIVIVSPASTVTARPPSLLRRLNSWDKNISVITNPEKSYSIIKQLEKTIPLEELAYQSHQLKIDNEWYDLYRVDIGSDDVYLFIINTITENRRQITEAAFNSILIALAGLILTEGLLLFMLGKPVSRLANLAANLPLLVEGQYQQLRDKLRPDRTSMQFINEIDITLDATIELADRLESLQLARQQAEQDLAWLADHDTLTELVNRRRFQSDFESIINQAKRYRHHGALLFIDLDAFKEINDLNGHIIGDKLLRQVADTLRKLVRNTDLLARLGGDEFAIVVPESSESEAIEFADKICMEMSKISVSTETFVHFASVSIGIALFPEHGETVPELMANADMSMYQSKKNRPGQSHLFSINEQAREKLNQRLLMKDLVTEALDNDLFELQYQPIINVQTNCIKYYEALIRIRTRDGGLVYPDSFIPMAEQTGLIRKIDQWIIERAIKVLLEQPEIALSINLSSFALTDELVVDLLAHKLGQSGVNPSRLLLEVTESGVIDDINTAVIIMRKFHSIGCKFALDDFGTGFASYNHLKMLPVDIIKIDGCFIKNIETSVEDRLFVKSITEIAGSMNMQIVAEYVENGAILEILHEIGVLYAQGYHIGKPAALGTAKTLNQG